MRISFKVCANIHINYGYVEKEDNKPEEEVKE